MVSFGYGKSVSLMPFYIPAHPTCPCDGSDLPSAPVRARQHPAAETVARHMLARCLRLLRRACSAATPPRTHSNRSWVDYRTSDINALRPIAGAARYLPLARREESSVDAVRVVLTVLKHGAPKTQAGDVQRAEVPAGDGARQSGLTRGGIIGG